MQSLTAKYNMSAPRYTAYPPANFFSDTFTCANYLQEIAQSNQPDSHISIYIHIPYCRKLCFYCGCNSCLMADTSEITAYTKALKAEMKMILGKLDPNRRVAQIHYGGGTPNTLPAEELQTINELVLSSFNTIEDPEIAIECHPALLTSGYITGLHRAGFNRFSLGIQDFDHKVLQTVHRDPPAMPIAQLIDLIRNGRSEVSVNLDFIYGLPGQTVQSFTDTMQKAAAVHPNRIVTFSYAHVPWVNKNQQKLEAAGLPDPMEKTAMYDAARAVLIQHNYQPVGLDHYVMPGDELYTAMQQSMLHRNFQGYCTRRTTGQVSAFGVSAISQLTRSYAQNTKSVTDYIRCIGEGIPATAKGYRLNDDEMAIRHVLTELMCNQRIVWADAAQQSGISVSRLLELVRYNSDTLDAFASDGIITYSASGLQITDRGSLFVRNVAASFDPLLQQNNGQRYSKTM